MSQRSGKRQSQSRREIDDVDDAVSHANLRGSQFGKKKQRISSDNSDETILASQNNEILLTQTQASQSTIQSRWDSLSANIRKSLVNSVVRLFIFKDTQKVPVKREEINKLVEEEVQMKGLTTALIQEASKRLKEVFGYSIKVLYTTQRVRGGAHVETIKKKSNQYMLINNEFDTMNTSLISSSDQQAASDALLMTILAEILLSKNKEINGEVLFKSLERLLVVRGVNHPLFGEIGDAVKKMCLQKYLERLLADSPPDKEQSSAANYSYRIGPRAKHEIGEFNIFRFIISVYKEETVSLENAKDLNIAIPRSERTEEDQQDGNDEEDSEDEL